MQSPYKVCKFVASSSNNNNNKQHLMRKRVRRCFKAKRLLVGKSLDNVASTKIITVTDVTSLLRTNVISLLRNKFNLFWITLCKYQVHYERRKWHDVIVTITLLVIILKVMFYVKGCLFFYLKTSLTNYNLLISIHRVSQDETVMWGVCVCRHKLREESNVVFDRFLKQLKMSQGMIVITFT